MTGEEPFETLKRLNPEQRDPASARSREAQETLAHILAEPSRSRRSARSNRLRVVLPVIAAAAASAVAVILVLHARQPAPETVRCYAKARLDAPYVAVSGGHPITGCLARWRQGAIGSTTHLSISATELSTCLLRRGVVAVFPVGQGCRSLGLRPYRAGH